MAYVRIWVHTVWGTKKHTPFLTSENKRIVLQHINENASNKNIYIDFMNGHLDHIHCLISLNPKQCIADVIQLIKGESSFWINKNKIIVKNFEWSDEYYAVSVSESQVNTVRDYIKHQEEHHRKKTYVEEYNEFIEKHGFIKMKG